MSKDRPDPDPGSEPPKKETLAHKSSPDRESASSGTRSLLLAGFFLLGLLILLADQTTKYLARRDISPGEKIPFLGPLELTLVFNDGVAFGIGSGSGIWVITIISVLGLGALLFLLWTAPVGNLSFLAGALIVSGALGNLIDRLRAGEVTDMLLLPHWPAFNIADIAITSGSLLLGAIIIRSIIIERGAERTKDNSDKEGFE